MNVYKSLIGLAVSGLLLGGGVTLALADTADVDKMERIDNEASLAVGYRGLSSHGDPGRAREFDKLEPSPLFKGKFFTDQDLYHFDFDVDYLNEDDYTTNLHLDYDSGVRLDLRSQRFYHNLDHIPYDNGYSSNLPTSVTPRTLSSTPQEGSRPDGVFNGQYRTFYTDQNPADDYGLRLEMNEAKLKVKCPDYPAHLNLSFWRYQKEGARQLQFVSEGSSASGCNSCHMQSRSRDIDLVTEEVKAGVDAHVGFVDVILEGLLRTFKDKESTPVDYFGSHSFPAPRAAGDYEHDELPDSRLQELSLKLNTAPSGGFFASTAFTVGKRENESTLNSLEPVDAETDYFRTSADVAYTPSENWTFNLRYRFLDMDTDNTSQIYNTAATAAFTPSPISVRSSLDVTRAWYEAVASYRPSKQLTLKAEIRREEIDRDDGPVDSWNLPEKEIVTRVKLGFISRLLEKNAFKLSGWVAIQQDDDPAYGITPENSQELNLAASYSPSPLWGVTTNINLLRQENDDFTIDGESVDRDKQQQNLVFGSWFMPREDLSFNLHYGYFRTTIDQSLYYGAPGAYAIPQPGFDDVDADFRQTVQTLSAGVTWQAREDLSCRLEGYHIRSKADYDPTFSYVSDPGGYFSNLADADSSYLHDISKINIVQNGLKGRVDWKVSDNLTCGVEATFDDYDEKGNDIYDGSVQSYMASLTYTF